MEQLLLAVLAGGSASLAVFAGAKAFSPDAMDRRIHGMLTGGGTSLPTARQADSAPAVTLKERIADLVVRVLNLRRWLELDKMRDKLQRAGKRGPRAETMFLMARFSSAIALSAIAGFYVFVLKIPDLAMPGPIGVMFFGGWLGLKLPEIVLDRQAKARAQSIRLAWPDALDLMLILVEAGKSVEQAFRRVVQDIASRSQPLAEELTITLAELTFLPERRQSYDNLGQRTGVSEVRSTCMAVIQAEEQGTSLGETFRALAADGRAARMAEAEKKGAQVATLMTLPVMVFFLPPLIILSVMPMIIQFMKWS
ncbi:type II secretion system F family protein [Xanthobacter sp. DSM 14520]|uniref:type II secretion system F family protein n=1 Tax=Xanthobacter autotrophicus (strain ATCC BAA-1158 / Py2) TaxID=78245 RepID=UPI003729417B